MLSRRGAVWAAGVVLVWALAAPLAAGSFVVHMVLHLAAVAVVPWRLGPRLSGAPGPAVLAAAVALEMVVVWGWHAPAAHLWARDSFAGFALEQASFLTVGCVLWAAAQAAGRFGGALVLLVTVMHMTLLGVVVGLAPRPLYAEAHAGLLGLGAMQEQQLGGALMATLGAAVYLAAAIARLAPALALETEDDR